MKKILITGASGFIGSFIVEDALKKDLIVYAGIRESSSKKYLQDNRINFINLDFSDKDGLIKIIKDNKFDYIVHNAGLTKAKKKDDFDIVNFQYTKNFIDAIVASGSIPEKFILISSMAAIGPGDDSDTIPVKSSDKPYPDTLYGLSKIKAEEYIATIPDFPYIIIRPTGVYGPRETDYFVFFNTINKGIEPYIGLKEQHLTFIYVKDLVNAIFLALISNINKKAYIVSDGNSYTAKEFAVITKKHLNKKTFKLYVPLFIVKTIVFTLETISIITGKVPTLNKDKYNVLKSRNWLCDTSDLQEDLNFKAQYDLDKGVKETIEWYKKEKWL